MADQNITALPATTTPESSDQLLLVGATEEKLIDYDKLADAILGKIASKNFALDQGNKTLLAALNELNSKTSKLVALYCIKKSNTNSSGTLTFTYNASRCSIIMFITQNQKDSSLYYIGINTFNNATITKLAGANCDISVDNSKKTIYVALPDWSSATLLSPDIA